MAIGVGVHTNPLHGGDNIPLVVLPSIQYYGEHIFLDNNVLGYTLLENQQLAVSVITQLNHQKAYFTRWHPDNILVDMSSIDFTSGEMNEENADKNVSVADISHRRWAIDAGLQLNWFFDKNTDISMQLVHDINSVYHGFNANIKLNRLIRLSSFPNTFLSLGVGANWNSDALVDYYYGIDQQDDLQNDVFYQGKSSINPFFSLAVSKRLTTNLGLKINIKRLLIDGNTADSPLVEKRQIDSLFLGMEYDF